MFFNGREPSLLNENEQLDKKESRFGDLEKIVEESSPISHRIKDAIWVKPEYVCEVEYAEITKDNYLRQPVFKRLRDDIDPKEVTFQGSPT